MKRTIPPRRNTAAALLVVLLLAAGCDRAAPPLSITPPAQPPVIDPLDHSDVVALKAVEPSGVVHISVEIEALPPIDASDELLVPSGISVAPRKVAPITAGRDHRPRDAEVEGASAEASSDIPSVLRQHATAAQPAVPLHHEPAYASAPTIAPPNQLDETGILAWGPSSPTPELFAVAREADAHVARGIQMAERGARYTARAEFLQALRLSADALDQQRETTAHRRALSAALAALDEAKSFLGPSGGVSTNLTVADIVAGHHTPLLKRGDDLAGLTPADAMQRYFTFAQEQLASAGGDLAPAASALYALGKLEMLSLPTNAGAIGSIESARAVVYFQAALVVQPQHALAANELGVLLARHGRLSDAKAVLLHSVRTKAEPSAWHNLAVVHAQLGEVDLAARAEQHSKQSTGQTSAANNSVASGGAVEWVDSATFARTSQIHGNAVPATAPAENATQLSTPATASRHAATPRITSGAATWFPWSRSQR